MIILGSPTEVLRARLAAAAASTNPSFSFAWGDDGATRAVGNTRGVMDGTTNVLLVTSPLTGYNRVVRSGFIYNADSAPVAITIEHFDGTNAYPVCDITLGSGYTLTLGDDGFRVTDTSGAEVSGGSGTDVDEIIFDSTAVGNITSGSVVTVTSGGVKNPSLDTSSDVAGIIGIAYTSANNGNPIRVMREGQITETGWAWTVGPIYCAETGGALTQTVPSAGAVIPVAIALSANTLQVGIQSAYLRGD